MSRVESEARTPGRRRAMAIAVVVAVSAVALVATVPGPAGAATKVDPCTVATRAALETAVGNPFDAPQNTTVGPIEASCRFASSDVAGADLNLVLSTNVKRSTKPFGGTFPGTQEAFARIYGAADPVPGIGKTAYTAFEPGSTAQGALVVLDRRNHGVLVVLTGSGVTADDVVERGAAVANVVLPHLK